MQRITPFLWFDQNAEEAVEFYTSVFKNSKIKQVSRYLAGADPIGRTFQVDNQGGDTVQRFRIVGLARDCSDPATLVMASLGLAAVAIAASLLPAHRAATLDPVTALRDE